MNFGGVFAFNGLSAISFRDFCIAAFYLNKNAAPVLGVAATVVEAGRTSRNFL
jgi:hypothetical protein